MAATRTVLWVDSLNNRLIGGWNALVWAGKQTFNQGDMLPVTIRQVRKPSNLDSSMEEVPFAEGSTITLSIGNASAKPVGGKWSVAFAGNETELLDYNLSAIELSIALNSLASIALAGGVYVDKSNDDTFKVTFYNNGARAALTASGDSLIPQSRVIVGTVNAGASDAKAVFTLTLRQLPIAKVTSWAVENACDVVVTAVSPAAYDISLTTQPKDGYFSVKVGDGDFVNMSVYDSGKTLQNALGGGYVVSKQGDYSWRIESVSGASYAIQIADADKILSFSGLEGVLDLTSTAVQEFLSGATSVDTTIEITNSYTGVVATLLRNTCTVTSKIDR